VTFKIDFHDCLLNEKSIDLLDIYMNEKSVDLLDIYTIPDKRLDFHFECYASRIHVVQRLFAGRKQKAGIFIK
jgi:hypothetical protein